MTETLHLTKQLELATTKITSTTVMVDAEMAKRWLTHNVRNRPIRQTVVAKYKADMRAGRWLMAGDPIRFNVDGDLVDGQHRLSAMVEIPELALPFLVIRGLPVDAQSVMDQGIKRSAGDQLDLIGVPNSKAVAASVKTLLIWEGGLLFRDTKLQHAISSPQIERWVAEHPKDMEFFQSVLGDAKRNEAPPSVAGAVAVVLGRIDPEGTATFLRMLSRGSGTEGHPIATLDRRLRKLRNDRTKFPDRDYIALFIQSWNAWRGGRRITQFPRPKGGTWSPETFPVPR